MVDTSALFDFSSFIGNSNRYVQMLTEFAAGSPFRSATVDELVLDDDFCRRALRREDLTFLKFTDPIRDGTVSRLPSLASQRFLSSLYELTSAASPHETGLGQSRALAEFASQKNRQYAAQLIPFLESFAFDYLGNCISREESALTDSNCLRQIYMDEYHFWRRLLGQLKEKNYLREGLSFIFIQRWSLAPSVRRVLMDARQKGRLDGLEGAGEPRLETFLLEDAAMGRMATTLSVGRLQHSYWQFYLGTSLSKSNFLWALSRRERPFALRAALYAAQAEWLAFVAAIGRYGQEYFGGRDIVLGGAEPYLDLLRSFEAALTQAAERDPGAVCEMGQGLAAAGKLADRARWDLNEQLKWLSAIDRYCGYARRISERIERECPGIDRETFVEPREMCSTTHVHDDHRLVTIQAGAMHFWGNLGMRLQMDAGDMVLIPEGRLHGSTVVSAECTYHQPIIPDAWVRELLGLVQVSTGDLGSEEGAAEGCSGPSAVRPEVILTYRE